MFVMERMLIDFLEIQILIVIFFKKKFQTKKKKIKSKNIFLNGKIKMIYYLLFKQRKKNKLKKKIYYKGYKFQFFYSY